MRSSVTWVRSRIQLVQNYLHLHRHHKWRSKAEFIASCVGYCIGFGNIWRFPYIVHKYGGGSFILPYVISMIVLSIPMFYLECLLGQFTGCNAVAAFNFAPVCRGIGFAMTLLPVYICLYYGVFMAYSLRFTLASFAHRLPWDFCDPNWGADERCFDVKAVEKVLPLCSKWTNKTHKPIINIDCRGDSELPSAQYWKKVILHLEENGKKYSLEDIGTVQLDLLLALMVCWLVQVIVISRGTKTIARVAYFTAVIPFIIMLCMLIHALLLNGAGTGLKYLVVPEWKQLADGELWIQAISQAFFSTGICFGCIILYSSYNKFHDKLLKSVCFIVMMDFLGSIISTIIIFAVLGYMAEELQIDIEKVVEKGPGLIFVVMPRAIAELPIPQFWSFLYFIMLYASGNFRQAAQLDIFLTCIYEETFRFKYYIQLMRFLTCCIVFILSIPLITNAGVLMIDFIDHFVINFSLLILAICEIIAVMYIYGWNNFLQDLAFMTGSKVNGFWMVNWRFFCPSVLLVILVIGIMFSKACENYNDEFCIGGWFVSLSIIIQIPIGAIYNIAKYARTEQGVKAAFKPIFSWGPRDVVDKIMYLEWQRQRGVPLGIRTTTGLEELEAEGPDMKTGIENRMRQRKYSVFYRFSKVFMPEELEEMERNGPPRHQPTFILNEPTTSTK